MKKTAQGTVLVKWIRSGIGFPRRQKEMVRSLGLRRLNQVIECPDTPQVRGLVASVPHLVQIVGEQAAPAWASVAEYQIKAAAPPAEPASAVEPAPATVEEPAPGEASSAPAEAAAPKKRSRAKKSTTASESAEASAPDEK